MFSVDRFLCAYDFLLLIPIRCERSQPRGSMLFVDWIEILNWMWE
ncbi:hypothetical protein [Candidatus Hodgkinia cicadicola]